MSLVRSIARPLLAAPFIIEGLRTAAAPQRATDVYPDAFESADKALRDSPVPDAIGVTEIVRATGAVAAGAGLLYATNRSPRIAAALLLGTTTVGWVGRKKIWELSGQERLEELSAIAKDAGLLGGVLLAVVDHDGHPSLRYRTERFIERSQKNAAKKKRELEKAADKTAGSLNGTTKKLSEKLG